MNIQFSKMHGLGNDFMVIDNVTQNIFLSKDAFLKIEYSLSLVIEFTFDDNRKFVVIVNN